MDSTESITGFVLAGGKSVRIGQDKGLLPFGHKSMAQYSIDLLRTICDRVVIITSNPEYAQFGQEMIEDDIKNSGPLSGLVTGLDNSNSELNLFLTCDSPFITRELLLHLIENISNYDAVIPRERKRMYPLTALYRRSAVSKLREELTRGNLMVRKAVTTLNLKQLDIDSRSPIWNEQLFSNLNTFEGIAEAKKWMDDA